MPVACAAERTLQCVGLSRSLTKNLVEQCGNRLIVVGARPSTLGLLVQSCQALLGKTLLPMRRDRRADAALLSNMGIGRAVSSQQNDAGTAHQRVRQ